MPVITAIAFRLQDQHARLTQLSETLAASHLPDTIADADTDEEQEARVHELTAATFVADQILQIAMMEDYGDEIGRRKMFTLIREPFLVPPPFFFSLSRFALRKLAESFVVDMCDLLLSRQAI